MSLRLKPVARSLSVRAEFFGLELEDWGLLMGWAIVMRLIADQVHRVFFNILPVSSALSYGSSVALFLVIRWAKGGKPRGYLIAWIQQLFRPRVHCARVADTYGPYLLEDQE